MQDVTTFDRFARIYDLAMPAADPTTLREAIDLADGSVDMVVDLGGGTGRGGRALEQATVVVDPARGMVERAVSNGEQAIQGTAERLPFGSAEVDAVVVVDAIHHFGDPVSAIQVAATALRPGGVLVVRDFDPRTLRGRLLVIAEHLLGFDSQFLSLPRLEQVFEDIGLVSHVIETGFTYTIAGVKPRQLTTTPSAVEDP